MVGVERVGESDRIVRCRPVAAVEFLGKLSFNLSSQERLDGTKWSLGRRLEPMIRPSCTCGHA